MEEKTVESKIVEFNVGGKVFMTQESTITLTEPSSLLAKLIKYPEKKSLDKNGMPFIDRCPKKFAMLLEYLRTHETPEMDEPLKREAAFYGFEKLLKSIDDMEKDEQKATKREAEQTDKGPSKKRQRINCNITMDMDAAKKLFSDMRPLYIRKKNTKAKNFETYRAEAFNKDNIAVFTLAENDFDRLFAERITEVLPYSCDALGCGDNWFYVRHNDEDLKTCRFANLFNGK